MDDQGFTDPADLPQIWGGPSPKRPSQAEPQPQFNDEEPQQPLPPHMRPPGRFKLAMLIGLQLGMGMLFLLGRGLKKLVGLGLIATGRTLQFLTGSRPNANGSRKKMSLRSVFLGAALVTGAMMAPGAYYMTQPNEIVRTRVTGVVEADAKAEFPGQKYIIYTNQGKFDTYGVEGGSSIKQGCVYDFNVKSARIALWPPGYTRSIQSFKPAPGGNCAP